MYRNLGGYCVNMHCSIALSVLSFFFCRCLPGGGRLTRVGVGGLDWRGVLGWGGTGGWGELGYSIQTVTMLGPVVFIALEIACCILYVVPF